MRQWRGLAAFDPVEQQRRVDEFSSDLFDLVHTFECLDEQHIGASIAHLATSFDCLMQPIGRPGIGPSNDKKFRISTSCHSCADLGDHLACRHHRLIFHMATLLGHDLIFDMDPGNASLLERPHRMAHVDRVAITSIGIGEHRKMSCRHDPTCILGHLIQTEKSYIRLSE